MKKLTLPVVSIILFVLLTSFFVLKSRIIQNPKPEECEIVDVKITRITEGTDYDIVFYNNVSGLFYINRGLEKGLNLESLKRKVLNKTVTLHLAKILGDVTSEHISQLTVNDEIIYTEFD